MNVERHIKFPSDNEPKATCHKVNARTTHSPSCCAQTRSSGRKRPHRRDTTHMKNRRPLPRCVAVVQSTVHTESPGSLRTALSSARCLPFAASPPDSRKRARSIIPRGRAFPHYRPTPESASQLPCAFPLDGHSTPETRKRVPYSPASSPATPTHAICAMSPARNGLSSAPSTAPMPPPPPSSFLLPLRSRRRWPQRRPPPYPWHPPPP